MFVSVNEPENFNWHDAVIEGVKCENGKMIWMVDALNVTAENSQNSGDIDLCANTATATFENFSVEKIEYYGYTVSSHEGDVEVPGRNLSREEISEFVDHMIHSANEKTERQILSQESRTDGGKLYISMEIDIMYDGENDGIICMNIKCDKLTVEWDGFVGKAWYWDWDKKYGSQT